MEGKLIELLIRSAQKGNKAAFRKLVEHYDARIFALIYRYTSDAELAKDIYQEVFLNVYTHIRSFSFKSDFFTWLYRITVNTALSSLKKERKHSHTDIESHTIESFLNENHFLMNEILAEAKKLPNKQRLVFFMRFQNDLKLSEIATALNVDVGTVKGYLSRSIKKIRDAIEIM